MNYVIYLSIMTCLFSFHLHAQKTLMLGGWVPYWRTKAAMTAIKQNYDTLDEFSLFSLEMDTRGNLTNPFKYCRHHCSELLTACKQSKKPLIATIYWTDTAIIHRVLSSKDRREEHVRQIIEATKKYELDGININYERTSGKDREDYILFLRKLSLELHRRGSCFIRQSEAARVIIR